MAEQASRGVSLELPSPERTMATPLFVTVLVIATCGLVYELSLGTLASYLLGDSVTQFSTVIGAYMFALGIGAWLSRFVDKGLPQRFVEVELLVALLGGFSAPALFWLFGSEVSFRLALYGVVTLVGTLVGLEIPLLLRILQNQVQFKDLVSRVLTFDYLGALAASVFFPLLFVPKLGLVRTSLLFGILNAAVALWSTYVLAPVLLQPWRLRIKSVVCLAVLAVGFVLGQKLTDAAEGQWFHDPVVHAQSTAYQRVVMTQGTQGISLFLNGNLQFSEADEYRYHEALVHPLMARAERREKVLILGGGDGLALREVLKYPEVQRVVLVDLDPAMTELGRTHRVLRRLNEGAMDSPKVQVINQDAFQFVRESKELFDVAVVDFPDPNNFSLGKLYTTAFYRGLAERLSSRGVAVVQSTSPMFARESFWCIEATLAASGFVTQPYHAWVPSFGEWGYVLVGKGPLPLLGPLPEGLRFLSPETESVLGQFPADMAKLETGINRLNSQRLVHLYEAEWRVWN